MAKQYHIPRTINKIEVKVWQVSGTEALKINIFTYIRKKINSFKRVRVINLLSVSKIPNILPPWHFIHARHVVNITLLSFFIDGKKLIWYLFKKDNEKANFEGLWLDLAILMTRTKKVWLSSVIPLQERSGMNILTAVQYLLVFFYFLVKNNFALRESPS